MFIKFEEKNDITYFAIDIWTLIALIEKVFFVSLKNSMKYVLHSDLIYYLSLDVEYEYYLPLK